MKKKGAYNLHMFVGLMIVAFVAIAGTVFILLHKPETPGTASIMPDAFESPNRYRSSSLGIAFDTASQILIQEDEGMIALIFDTEKIVMKKLGPTDDSLTEYATRYGILQEKSFQTITEHVIDGVPGITIALKGIDAEERVTIFKHGLWVYVIVPTNESLYPEVDRLISTLSFPEK